MKEVRWTKLFGGNPPPSATHIVDLDAAILGAVGGFVLGTAVVTGIDWVLTRGAGVSMLPDLPIHEHARYWLHAAVGDETWLRYLEWIESLKADGRYLSYIARLGAVVALPSWLAFKMAKSGMAERERFIHRAGRQLVAGQRANDILKRKTRIECKADGSGLMLHPSVTLSLRRETGHCLVMGSSGGGKTVILKPFIWRAVARGDKCLIYDNKGEITEELPARFVLIAPWDKRSAAWDIAADCRNIQDARELAAKFIPDSKDPMWSAAAQQIFTAMLSELMHTRGKDWGWSDLAEMVVKTNEEVKDIVARRVPEAMDAVADAESKTTLSIMITMKSFMSDVLALAKAWRDKPGHRKRRRISFTRFVTDPDYRYKRIVLQGSGRYQKMTQKVIGGILQSVSAVMNSGACSDSPTRRIWLFLDEFPQLGKVDGFNAFLEVGRSKGFRVVVGVQDYNQLTQIYSKEECDTFLSQIKTQVFVKFPAGPTAEWVSNLVGTRRVQMPQQSISSSVGGPGGGGTASVSFNETDLPVIHPAALEAKLGTSPEWSGVQGLLLGWDDAYFLRWPFVPAKKLRAAVIEADWCTIVRENPTETPGASPAKPEDGNPSEGGGDEMNIVKDVGASQASSPKKKFILRGKGEGEEAREGA
jgi:type IV secretory pathway TraG/TraD family ATPase VirD4